MYLVWTCGALSQCLPVGVPDLHHRQYRVSIERGNVALTPSAFAHHQPLLTCDWVGTRLRLVRAHVALVARLHGPVYELPRAMTVLIALSARKEEPLPGTRTRSPTVIVSSSIS